MFRALIPPIFRSTRLCRWPATSWVHYTTSCNRQSSASEDGRNHRPKHVQLIGFINKPLLLHLVGCLYYLSHLSIAIVWKYQLSDLRTNYLIYNKCKFVPICIMVAYGGRRGRAPFILKLDTGWRWMVSPTPQPFFLGVRCFGFFSEWGGDTQLCGPQYCYWCFFCPGLISGQSSL